MVKIYSFVRFLSLTVCSRQLKKKKNPSSHLLVYHLNVLGFAVLVVAVSFIE